MKTKKNSQIVSDSGVICSAICLQTSNFYLKLLMIKISGL